MINSRIGNVFARPPRPRSKSPGTVGRQRRSPILPMLFVALLAPALAVADGWFDAFDHAFQGDLVEDGAILLAASGEPLKPNRPPPKAPVRPPEAGGQKAGQNDAGPVRRTPVRPGAQAADDNDAGPVRRAPIRAARAPQNRLAAGAAVAMPAAGAAPRLPAPNRIGPPPRVPARPVVVGTELFAPNENSRITNPPATLRLRIGDDSPRVYDSARVPPFRFNPADQPTFVVGGSPIKFDKYGAPYLNPDALMGNTVSGTQVPVGKLLGGGANSRVYTSSSNTNVVKKFVWLENPNGGPTAITDQNVGRAILEDIAVARPKSPFRVVKRIGDPMTVKATQGGREYNFVLSREENIASQVINRDPASPNYNKPVTITNAQDRLAARAPRHGRKRLTNAEELTINLVIRDLNAEGVVWTDHKLANLDIVPDATSPTGHRVVFFDLDAFRPVRGATRAERMAAARDLQQAFDSNEGRADLGAKYNAVVSRRYPDGQGPFDFTAFGGPAEVAPYMFTANANVNRLGYKAYNDLTVDTFADSLVDFATRRLGGT